MSSEIATSLAGHEAGALDRAHQHRERLLVGVERGPPPAFVGDAGQLAGVAHQLAGRAIDLGGHRERLANDVAPTGITIRSWMSIRRPACAPPPKIWISGSGSETGLPPAR